MSPWPGTLQGKTAANPSRDTLWRRGRREPRDGPGESKTHHYNEYINAIFKKKALNISQKKSIIILQFGLNKLEKNGSYD